MSKDRDINAARRLIIHCGVQKTASTSLHHLVRRNRDLLGAHLEVLTPVRRTPVQQMGRAAMQFSLDPSPEREKTLVDLIRGLRDRLTDGTGPVLISHENLPGAMLGKGGVRTLYPQLEQILALLEAHFKPLVPEYVFYTREMAVWKNSVYNQAVKSDHYPHTRAQFESDTAKCGTWDELERRVQALVGARRSRFFRLEDETDTGRPGLQLLRHAGLDDRVIDALDPLPRQANQSLNGGSLEFLRRINGLGLERGARRKVATLVQETQGLFAVGGKPS